MASSRADPRGTKAAAATPRILHVTAMAAIVFLASLLVASKALAQSQAITLSETTLNVNESSSATYTVKLATQPTGDVTVTITGASETDLNLNKTSLTFTTSTWDTEQTVSVLASADDDAKHDLATLTHTGSGGDYGSVTADLTVTVSDNTRMRLTAIVENVVEGESMQIRATLPMPLDEDVTVTVEVAPNGAREDEYTLSTNRMLTIAADATHGVRILGHVYW